MAGLAGAFAPGRNLFVARTRSGFKVELKGLSDLTKKLEGRVRRMEQSALRKACQAFAEPIRADAQRRARALVSTGPVDISRPGFSDIEIGIEIKIRGTTANVRIGPLGKYFWLFFFEYGYWIRTTKKGPKITWVSHRPTFRAAYDAHKAEGLLAMEKILFEAFATDAAA